MQMWFETLRASEINKDLVVDLRGTLGFRSLQFSSVWHSGGLFEIPAHTHADCDLDRDKLASQVSWKILIPRPEPHKTDKWNRAEVESDDGTSVQTDALKAFHIYNP